jgi:hypothetical protein
MIDLDVSGSTLLRDLRFLSNVIRVANTLQLAIFFWEMG